MRRPSLRIRAILLGTCVVVVLIWGGMAVWRSYDHWWHASYYAEQERGWRSIAERKPSPNDHAPRIADYYAGLVRKRRRAMWRPWATFEGDFPPPVFRSP